MSVVVMKFGGTSLATSELIMSAAKKVSKVKKKHDVVVVVSAMGHATDELMVMSKAINPNANARELDMLLTAGERISVALLSMALGKLNLEAVSYTGSQVGIITDTQHTDAKILEIRSFRLEQTLDKHKIPVVCGFQGVSTEKEITTLGRGGSDTTALALSATLNAEKCLIYTDVDGVFTEDPFKFPGVKKIDRISYDEMLELSSRGAQILHPRASRVAARYHIPVEIRNSFTNKSGTLITDVGGLEKPRPRAITHSDNLYLVTLVKVAKRPKYLSQIVTELADHGICLKFFFHGISYAKKFNLSFITPLHEKDRVKSLLEKTMKKLGVSTVRESTDICSVSIIGRGCSSENKVLADIFRALSKNRLHIEALTTSELSINLFLRKKYLKRTINTLLAKFHLKNVTRRARKIRRGRRKRR